MIYNRIFDVAACVSAIGKLRRLRLPLPPTLSSDMKRAYTHTDRGGWSLLADSAHQREALRGMKNWPALVPPSGKGGTPSGVCATRIGMASEGLYDSTWPSV